jgi:signal transduction histidine kinase
MAMPSPDGSVPVRAADAPEPVSSFDQVRLLVDAVERLSLARSIPEIQSIVRHAARRLTGADGATFVLRDGEYCFYADEEAIAPLWKGQRFPLETCISGWAMLNRAPALIEDIYVDERIPHEAYRATFVKSLAMVPMRSADPVGAIGNYWATRHTPSGTELELLQALADSTAVAMENVRVYQELEQRVQQRTHELERRTEELRTANERLVELDAMRTRFAHATTHELRTPLTTILGFGLMLAAQLPEPHAERAALICQSATRLSALVDDLLTVAELEHGELTLRPEEVAVSDIVAGSAGAFATAAAEAGLQLEANAEQGLTLRGDPLRIAQVLDNLISNAIKYTPAGGRVEVRAAGDDGDVVITVADDGIGIAPEDRGQLFQPFFRTSAGRAAAPGTGLGLRISRDIADAHGGSLTFREPPGPGSVFELRLPAQGQQL